MNILAKKLNEIISLSNSNIIDMLSTIGKNLFFPKGILSQSAEAKQEANIINATIGIAKENNKIMHLKTLTNNINQIKVEDALSYAPSFGLPNLRKLWKINLYQKNPSLKNKKISLPLITCGITHGISIFAEMWVEKNDIIIIPDMKWGNYEMIFSVRRGAKISNFSMFNEEGKFNIKGFTKKIKEKSLKNKKIIVILNFPNNPTGYSPTINEALTISKVMVAVAESGTKIIALCDDAYFGLFYNKNNFKESLFSILSNTHKNLLAVKVDGSTKEDFSWGLRIGFLTYGCYSFNRYKGLYKALEMKTGGCIRGTISNASHLSQIVLLKSLKNNLNIQEKKEKFNILKSRFEKVNEIVNNKKFLETWKVYPFNSGYFMCIKIKTVDANKLRLHLLKKYGVGVIAINFENIRIAYSCIEIQDIEQLFETIFIGIKELKAGI